MKFPSNENLWKFVLNPEFQIAAAWFLTPSTPLAGFDMAMENCTGRWRPQRREIKTVLQSDKSVVTFLAVITPKQIGSCGSNRIYHPLWYLVHIGLWYLGDASKVFMLANHALTRRYLRSTGQLVGRRQAFFQNFQHCFPILLPCSGSQEKRYHSIKIFSVCMLADWQMYFNSN